MPQILREIHRTVGQHHPEIPRYHQPQAPGSQADARKEQGGEDEDGSVAAVMVAQMNRGEPPAVLFQVVLLPEEDVAGKMKTELCGHPREGEDHDHGSHDEPQRITGSAGRERPTCAPSGRDRQTESQDDAERRERIDPARVQVVLVDRERHHCAEADRGSCDQPCLG